MNTPEIYPCPNCKTSCEGRRNNATGLCRVYCGKPFEGSCGYNGPFASHMGEAIRLHNALCTPAAPSSVREVADLSVTLDEAAIETFQAISGTGEDIAAVRLDIGWVKGDEGEPDEYGLRVMSADYPEEGACVLVVLPAPVAPISSPAPQEAEALGSSKCPICGKDFPHYHSPEEQAQHNEKVKSASLKQIEAAYPDMMFVPRSPTSAGIKGDALKAAWAVWAHISEYKFQPEACAEIISKHFPAQGLIPEGWKLVPVEPTQEMWKAADSAYDEYNVTPRLIHPVWSAMLASAPSQEGETAPAPISHDTAERLSDAIFESLFPNTNRINRQPNARKIVADLVRAHLEGRA